MKQQNSNFPLITNIQRFSLHDGPGIRTTIFLKGCSLCCPWCSNPENLSPFPQKYYKDGVERTYGIYLSCKKIYKEIMKDRDFFGEYQRRNGDIVNAIQLEELSGGVTFSGGEALLQVAKLEPLFILLKESNIHMSIETCLFVSPEVLNVALQYIDLFYVDVKILDRVRCKAILSGDLSLYLRNIKRIADLHIPMVIRIPVIGGYTDGVENKENILRLLKKNRPIKVELIKGHNLGAPKYVSLGMKVPDFTDVSDKLMEQYKTELEEIGINTEICEI